MTKNSIKKALLISALTMTLGACGSIYEKEPVGVGKDISELP